ncbi:hypothetical protein TNCV_1618071 [Trichonephila clavipes]|nr:hypothetical protein TNCV_1618071 [Trichonephila clavipes]
MATSTPLFRPQHRKNNKSSLYHKKVTIKIWNEVLLNWMEGELGYCISMSKGKAIGKLRGILSLLGNVVSLLIAEDAYVGQYPLHSLGCNYSINKCNYDLSQLGIALLDHLECNLESENCKMPLEFSIEIFKQEESY